MNAIFPSFVIAGAEYASGVWLATYGNRFADELGVVSDFDGCVEAVHVDVDNLSGAARCGHSFELKVRLLSFLEKHTESPWWVLALFVFVL